MKLSALGQRLIQQQDFFAKGAVFLAPRFLKHIFWGLVLAASIAPVAPVSFGAADDEKAKPLSQLSVTSHATISPVIELYTSEGCSSCPKADNFMTELGGIIDRAIDQEFHAVPLAFHVDYWNDLGWRDPYSQPAFTARQREVAARVQQRTIYTPQFTVDGRDARGGANIIRAIRTANARPAQADIKLHIRRTANGIAVRIEVESRAPGDAAQAYLALYESGITRQIGGGENRGKTLHHNFVVRHFSQPFAIRHGANRDDRALEIPADWQRANLGVAVLVLDRASGTTVQALNASLAPLFAI